MPLIPMLARLSAALVCCLLAGPAHAGRPLQTEDAGVLDAGGCEVQGFTARSRVPGSTARGQSLQGSCGVGASTQLAVAVAQAQEGGLRARGLELSGKTAVRTSQAEAAGDAAGLSLAYAMAWAQRSGDRLRPAAYTVNLAYSRALNTALTLHGALGHVHDRDAQSRTTTWGLALEHAGFNAWAPMIEVFGDDRAAAWWNLGLRWNAVPNKFCLDASYGRPLAGGQSAVLTLGFKLAF